jgi:hypothetical protein
MNLEAKAFYAALRNFVSPLVGRQARPEPWLEAAGERRGRGDRVQLSTARIIDNLVADMAAAGFGELSDELGHTHRGLGSTIRNAVAHATVLFPGPKTHGQWVFGNYFANAGGYLEVRETAISPAEFTAFVGRFFTFRFAFMGTFEAHREALRPLTFEFKAENQMRPGELLDCHFDRGRLSLMSKGTPVW